MIANLEQLSLSKDEQERVAALHHDFGFVVYNAGFSMVMEDRKVEMCYWQSLRGVRQSALFPTHEAAWRDALRIHDEAVDAVKANPGVHRVKQNPEGPELTRLKNIMKKAGYHFGDRSWEFRGYRSENHTSHAEVVRSAVRHWAKQCPDAFIAAMAQASSGVVVAATNMVDADREQEVQHEVKLGQGQVPNPKQDANYKLLLSQEEFGQAKALERCGYFFTFTVAKGWICSVGNMPSGALPTVVKAAWEHALDNGGDPKDMAAVARGYSMTDEDRINLVARMFPVEGRKNPPIGTKLWVTPHSTIWGFDVVQPHMCKVLAYHGEYVWLEQLSDTGESLLLFSEPKFGATANMFITTRIDKVDVKLWKGNKDV